MAGYIYLAGPITGMTYADAVGWRRELAVVLESIGYDVLDPMRNKEHLEEPFRGRPIDAQAGNDPFKRDVSDVRRADLVVANFSSGRIGTGSAVELGIAYALHKPVIVVSPQPAHPFIRGVASEVISDFDSLLEVILSYLPVKRPPSTNRLRSIFETIVEE